MYNFNHLTFNQNCTQLIQTIEDTGTIMREIRDLEEQVWNKLINTIFHIFKGISFVSFHVFVENVNIMSLSL